MFERSIATRGRLEGRANPMISREVGSYWASELKAEKPPAGVSLARGHKWWAYTIFCGDQPVCSGGRGGRKADVQAHVNQRVLTNANADDARCQAGKAPDGLNGWQRRARMNGFALLCW